MLIDIVAKGGNLLYNIAPGPDGTWHEEAYELLDKMGKWIDVNGEAIYGTREIAPYKETNICFTKKKDTDSVYAIYLAEENQNQMPSEVMVHAFQPKPGSEITLLGSKAKLTWKKSGSGVLISIPEKVAKNPPSDYAWVFEMTVSE
jgi:alpha-L-fucosidase